MCEVRNYVSHLAAGRDHDRQDSCYLCQALPAGAADDSYCNAPEARLNARAGTSLSIVLLLPCPFLHLFGAKTCGNWTPGLP